MNTNIEESNISNGSDTGSNSKGKQDKDNMALALNNMRFSHIKNIANSQHTSDTMQLEVLIDYDINASIEADVWNDKPHPISIFRYMEFLEIDAKNIFTFLLYIADFIRIRKT